MAELLALFTSDVLILIAYLAGAFLLAGTLMAGMFYVAMWFGYMS